MGPYGSQNFKTLLLVGWLLAAPQEAGLAKDLGVGRPYLLAIYEDQLSDQCSSAVVEVTVGSCRIV